jgi:tRNA threonylcarbamoyl adenosine modification protein (Sua5/YciO/YrdC/YwlC family)
MPPRAVCLAVSDEAIARCAAALVRGELVAFPTETVYGLGACALSDTALAEVYRVKGRPRTDPLIVHVASTEMALALGALSASERAAFCALAAAHWPGPLTLVVRAAPHVPKLATAGGDFVGLRLPAHPVALALLRAAGVPIAAPSANRFGHVSPTRAEHVVADLGAAPILVLDGGACPVGIESTVLRLADDAPPTVLRRGAITRDALAATLRAAGLSARVEVRERHVAAPDAAGQQSPGQLLTHYAPETPAYVLHAGDPPPDADAERVPLAACVLIDFAGRAAPVRARVRAAFELSARGDPAEAAAQLFARMREAERVADARAILLPDVRAGDDEPARAVHDRIFRAASGRAAWLAPDGTHALLARA